MLIIWDHIFAVCDSALTGDKAMNILFLSDLHFGRELISTGCFKNREKIQEELIQTIINLPPNMKPHYIVVTGDIAWTGTAAEYDLAYAWFSKLLSQLEFKGDRITFCAGNHDINRKAAICVPFTKVKNEKGFVLDEIDRLYEYENMISFNAQIQAYNDFCCRLGAVPYEYTSTKDADSPYADKMGMSKRWHSYASGYKDIEVGHEKFRILAFNSAMLSGYEGMPDDENFIGLPQLQQMMAENLIGSNINRYTIALFHHAERYLNTNEMNSYGSRPATYRLLLDEVDLALCGHTETGAVPVLQRQGKAGVVMNGGAAYYSDDHPNSFSILHIEPDTKEIESCTFICNNGNWIPTEDLPSYAWPVLNCEATIHGKPQKDQTWKFRLYTDLQEKEISIRYVDYGIYINGSEFHQYFTNRKDVNRLLDISGDEKGARIQVAPERGHSVEAMFERMDISYFIDSQVKDGKKEILFEVKDPEGKTILSGPMPTCKFSEDDYRIYDFLRRIRKLEINYGVRFSIPDKLSEQEQIMISFLENYLEDGGAIFAGAVDYKMAYMARNKAIFSMVYQKIQSREKEALSFEYEVPVVCTLFGAKIRLGMCKVFVVNLIPSNLEEVKKQAETFMSGDTRQLTMNFIKNYQQIVFLKNNWEQEHPELSEIIEPIYKRTYPIMIEPQALSLGADLFEPDAVAAEKKGIKLAQTLTTLREIYRPIWERQKGMLI